MKKKSFRIRTESFCKLSKRYDSFEVDKDEFDSRKSYILEFKNKKDFVDFVKIEKNNIMLILEEDSNYYIYENSRFDQINHVFSN